MPKLIIFLILLNLTYFDLSLSKEKKKFDLCKWDNQFTVPCLEIISNLTNSSQFSKAGINKIIINKKKIEESGVVDLIDVMKLVPDVNITQSGPKGQQASIFMRGTGSNHTLVMINGVPINDQSTTQGLHDFGVDFIQTIQQVEIYPGSSATHFGTNAIGGAINIILTGDYKDSYSFSSDKDSNYEFSGNKSYIFDKSSLNFKVGSVKNKTTSAKGNYSDEKDGLINYSTNINYENYINDKLRFYNNYYLRQTKTEYDSSAIKQYGYKGNNKMGSFQFGLENLDYNQKRNYVIYYNIYDREYDERGIIDTYDSEVIGLKYDFSKTIDQKISYGLGSEYKYDWGYFDNNGLYEATTKGHSDNFSVYANIGLNIFSNLNLSIFGRGDKHKHAGENYTYKLNFGQKLNDLNIGVSYMTGLRNPTLYELFGADNYGYSGNKNLKPEKSNTYEVYSDYDIFNNIKLSVRAFRSNINNNIEYISNKYHNDNDDVSLNQSGLNGNISFTTKKTDLNIFSSLLNSKKENGATQLRRPRKNYGIYFSNKLNLKAIGDLKLNIIYNHYDKHFDTHSSTFNTIEMDSTDIIDLKFVKKINNNELYFKINNLFDEKYQRPHGYNQENRIIKLGIKY